MAKLEIFLLGTARVVIEGRQLPGLGRGKLLALLAYLVDRGDRPAHRDELAGLLWPETSSDKARHSLRQSLVTLREAIDEDQDNRRLQITGDSIELDQTGDTIWSDTARFVGLLNLCDLHAHRRLDVCPTCARRMERALALYQGEYCAHFSLEDSPEFEDWLVAQREHFQSRATRAASALTQYYTTRHAHAQAEVVLRRWLEFEPWCEDAHRHLMQVLWLQGERATALRQYDSCRKALLDHLAAEPDAETTALYEEIARGHASGPTPPGQATDLGHPTPTTTGQTEWRTSLLGREGELDSIADLLALRDCRLLTLTGPGGIGKSRLALHVAEELAGQFQDGVHVARFSSSLTPELIIPTICRAFGLSGGVGHQSADHLQSWLRPRDLLLVLDDIGQLPGSGQIVTNILDHAPAVRIIVTSRERLDVRGEWVFTVEGLSTNLPEHPADVTDVNTIDPGLLEAAPACMLFVQIAARLRPDLRVGSEDWPAIQSICTLVGGLPLAIELAAAWAPALTLAEIAEELERNPAFLMTSSHDVPARHQSMRNVFDQSWIMLSPEEQDVFCRLSVFRGGFSRMAAEQVAGATLPILLSLVNKSFLRRDAIGRYGIHELLRYYGERILGDHAEEHDQVRSRHCLYYLEFLRHREAALRGGRQKETLREISADLDNIRVAWRWALAHDRIPDIAGAIHTFWLFCVERGWMPEGQIMFGLVASALDHPGRQTTASPDHDLVLAMALTRQGGYESGLGRYSDAIALLQRGIALLRALDAKRELALALNFLAAASHQLEEFETERVALRESLALFREVHDDWGCAYTLNDLGMTAHLAGDDPEALRLCEESLTLFQVLDERRGLAFVKSNLGQIAKDSGDREQAVHFVRESLALRRENEDYWGIAMSLTQLGLLMRDAGDHHKAETCFREALQTALRGSMPPVTLGILTEFATLQLAQGRPNDAREIVAVIQHHPAANDRIRARGEALLAQIHLTGPVIDPIVTPQLTFDELIQSILRP